MDIYNCLKILELESLDAAAELKRAYRDLALVWHPDRFPEGSRNKARAERKLRDINVAYETLNQILAAGHKIVPPTTAPGASDGRVEKNPPPPGGTAGNPAGQAARGPTDRPGSRAGQTAKTRRKPQPPGSGPAAKRALIVLAVGFIGLSLIAIAFLARLGIWSGAADSIASRTLREINTTLQTTGGAPAVGQPPGGTPAGRPADLAAGPAPPERYHIYLQSGAVISTQAWWEADGMIFYRYETGTIGIEKRSVKRIVGP
jgi:hypothetical protein